MAGPLSNDQLAAIHAKERNKGFATLTKEQQQQLIEAQNEAKGIVSASGYTLPSHEEKHYQRAFSGIKRVVGKNDAIHDAQVAQKKAADIERKKQLEKLDQDIVQRRFLREQLASKKIGFDEYLRDLAKIDPKEAKAIKDTLPSTNTKRQEGESEEDYNERMRIVKSKEQQEREFENIRNPSHLFPSGAGKAKKVYNPQTGKHYYTSAISPAEQRRLGVEDTVIEVPGDNAGSYVVIPDPKQPPKEPSMEKPTIASQKAEQEAKKEKKYESPSSGGNIADSLYNILEMG